MGSLHNLSNEIEERIVNDADGWGVQVIYTHSSGPQETINSMVSDGDFRRIREDREYSETTFFSLKLQTKPTIGDTISFDGRTWRVKDWSGSVLYDVVCEADATFTGARTNKRWQ